MQVRLEKNETEEQFQYAALGYKFEMELDPEGEIRA